MPGQERQQLRNIFLLPYQPRSTCSAAATPEATYPESIANISQLPPCHAISTLRPSTNPSKNPITCACTLCTKLRCLWLRGVTTDAFTVTRDEKSLVAYQGLQFCGNCGTAVTGEHQSGVLKGEVLVNARAVWGFDPFRVDLGSIKQIPAPAGDVRSLPLLLPSSVEGDTPPPAAHHGSCHCGNVRVELLVDIRTLEVKEDNCSSCNAYIGIYPTQSQVRIHGPSNTFEYLYGRRYNGAAHCKTCGVLVFNKVYGPPVSVFDRLPLERREVVLAAYYKNLAMQPVNVRALDDVDIRALKVHRENEGTGGYEIV